jgi:hypothetical protein
MTPERTPKIKSPSSNSFGEILGPRKLISITLDDGCQLSYEFTQYVNGTCRFREMRSIGQAGKLLPVKPELGFSSPQIRAIYILWKAITEPAHNEQHLTFLKETFTKLLTSVPRREQKMDKQKFKQCAAILWIEEFQCSNETMDLVLDHITPYMPLWNVSSLLVKRY